MNGCELNFTQNVCRIFGIVFVELSGGKINHLPVSFGRVLCESFIGYYD